MSDGSFTWEHRVIRTAADRVEFVEASYRDGVFEGYTEPFMYAENLDGLRELAQRLLQACDKQVIDCQEDEE